jgi:hypothetical protein
MRLYQGQHRAYCGVDLHARTMSLCITDPRGVVLLHEDLPASKEAFLGAIAPHRDGLVVACECRFAWYWLADTCHEHGIPFVLGHAPEMRAIHGTKTKNDKVDAEEFAHLLRTGLLPQALVDPAEMRATRDLPPRDVPGPPPRRGAGPPPGPQQPIRPATLPEEVLRLRRPRRRARPLRRPECPADRRRGPGPHRAPRPPGRRTGGGPRRPGQGPRPADVRCAALASIPRPRWAGRWGVGLPRVHPRRRSLTAHLHTISARAGSEPGSSTRPLSPDSRRLDAFRPIA